MDCPCPVCGTPHTGPIRQVFTDTADARTYRLHRCPDCDVEFWEPLEMPAPAYYERAVGEYTTYHEGRSHRLRPWHRQFKERFAAGRPAGRLLDIGCADGRFIEAMQHEGWNVSGIDFDERSVQAARRRCGPATIHSCSLDDAAAIFEPHSFDLITFFEVLEHQASPVRFVEQVKRLLKPGGLIGGSVPNRDRYVVPTRFSPDLPPHHFTLWTGRVLTRFFGSQGFVGVQTTPARFEPFMLDQILRHRFRNRIEALRSETGARSFQAGDYASPSRRARLLSLLRWYAWNPLMFLLTLPEHAILRPTGRGINLVFLARLGDAPPPHVDRLAR